MRVTNNMITSNTKSNINANKVLVDKYCDSFPAYADQSVPY